MVNKDTVEAALYTSHRRWHSGHGWFTNGHFAVRGTEWVALATEERPMVAKHVDDWPNLPKEAVLEAAELRIERTMGQCGECTDGQVSHEDCEDCYGHLCEDCNGTGESIDDVGQMVFTANGDDTVVDPALGHLLDGLTVFREAVGDRAKSMLMGYDNGEFVVAVMPRLEPVRR